MSCYTVSKIPGLVVGGHSYFRPGRVRGKGWFIMLRGTAMGDESNLVGKATGEGIPSLFSSLRFTDQFHWHSILQLCVMLYSFNLSTWEIESGGSGVQVQCWPHSWSVASLSYRGLCLNNSSSNNNDTNTNSNNNNSTTTTNRRITSFKHMTLSQLQERKGGKKD